MLVGGGGHKITPPFYGRITKFQAPNMGGSHDQVDRENHKIENMLTLRGTPMPGGVLFQKIVPLRSGVLFFQ